LPRTAGADFEDKVAMVTAATEGLGYACALRLAEAGCRVAICGRRAAVLEAARTEIERRAGTEVYAGSVDLARADQLEAFVRETTRRFDRLDILVVNTGHVPYGHLDDLREEDWYGAFELVLMSAVRLCRLVAPVMRAQGSGDIVVITSATVKEPAAGLLLSNVMRAGVAGLAKSLSRDLAPHGVRVNVVAPGYFDTGRVRRRIDEAAERDGVPRDMAVRTVAGEVPAGRIGTADELAELVVFLASRRAAFLTGATVQIDGGSSRGLF
jgi:3-oxoacyl-[acyl-carrier protein] reductase